MKNIHQKLLIILVFFISSSAYGSIYNSESEKHDEVTSCYSHEPFESAGTIYLDRDTFKKSLDIEELVEILLVTDANIKKHVASKQPGKDPANPKLSEHEIWIKNYKNTLNYLKVAECVVKLYREGDKIFHYFNNKILPSEEEGYVLVRENKIVLRVLTHAMYVD